MPCFLVSIFQGLLTASLRPVPEVGNGHRYPGIIGVCNEFLMNFCISSRQFIGTSAEVIRKRPQFKLRIENKLPRSVGQLVMFRRSFLQCSQQLLRSRPLGPVESNQKVIGECSNALVHCEM